MMDLQRLETLRRNASERFKGQEARWRLSGIDPAQSVASYSPLHVKPAFQLVLYQTRDTRDRMSRLFALPYNAEFPTQFSGEPRLDLALEHFMQAIDGDGSEWSYLLASLLSRDGEELANEGHCCNWGHRRLLTDRPFRDVNQLTQGANHFVDYLLKYNLDPCAMAKRYLAWETPDPHTAEQRMRSGPWTQRSLQSLLHRFWFDQWQTNRNFRYPAQLEEIRKLFDSNDTEWAWSSPVPETWQPQVTMGATIEVVFYSVGIFGARTIHRHHDTYTPLDYYPRRTR